MSSSGAYGQLVSTTDATSEPVEIDKNKFSIGRKPTSDLCLAGNKLISGSHGFIERDDEGRVWFNDTSTNGSLLNMTTKISKDRVELKHGDEIHLVYRKADPAVNVAYLYQDMKILAQEEADCTMEYSSDVDILSGDEKSKVSPAPKKRPAEVESSGEGTNPEPVAKKTKIEERDDEKQKDKEESVKDKKESEEKKADEITKKDDDAKENPAGSSSAAVSSSAVGNKSAAAASDKAADAFEETLICIICQEILHDCISLQPCMHSFCAGCYSDWMERSKECPSCRMNVDRINKNHIVNNLVEAYLKQNPGKRRDEEDIKELDAKNKITRDMLYPGKKKRNTDDDGDDDDDDSDSDDESPDEDDESPDEDSDGHSDSDDGGIAPPVYGFLGATTTYTPPRSVCRQCADYSGPHPAHGDGGIKATLGGAAAAVGGAVVKLVGMVTGKLDGDKSAAQPSTSTGPSTSKAGEGEGSAATSASDEKALPTPPVFTCTPYQTHILCNCCMQPLPDRRAAANIPGNNIPPIQCAVCSRAFCHAYWGCLKADCYGCIGKFGEINFGKRVLGGLILDNVYESEVFKVYVEGKGWSVRDVLGQCMEKLDNKTYTCPDQNRFRIDSTQVLCYACGLRNFKELAYQLRRDIPKAALPAAVTSRSDCYWGRNCRTARNKPHHATRFNHICDQTRTGT